MGAFGKAEAIQTFFPQIIQKGFAREAFHQRAENERAERIVMILRARIHRCPLCEIELHTVVGASGEPVDAALIKAGAHHQHIADGLLFQKRMHRFGQLIGEIVYDFIVKGELALFRQQTNGKPHIAFGLGIHTVRLIGGERLPVSFA